MVYKTMYALGCSLPASNDDNGPNDNAQTTDENTTEGSHSNNNESCLDSFCSPATASVDSNKITNKITKTIELGDLNDNSSPVDSKNTSDEKVASNQTIVVKSDDGFDLNIFALLAALLVSLLVLI